MVDFSLHAGVAAKAQERDKLERLCRYISRPAISEKRLSLTEAGNIRYQLKTPYRDGTTHVIFELLDFIAKLAAPVPKPRVNLTRFHGVFTPNSKHRAWVTPAKRGKGNQAKTPKEREDPTPAERAPGQAHLDAADRLYSTAVSRIRQPIEALFNWIQAKTGIEAASKVRSSRGLLVHVFGRHRR